MFSQRHRAGWLVALTIALVGVLTQPAAAAHPPRPHPASRASGLDDEALGCDRAFTACADRKTFQTVNNNRPETYSYRLALQLRGDPPRVRPALDIDAHTTKGVLRICQGAPTIRHPRDLRDRCFSSTSFSRQRSDLQSPILGSSSRVPCRSVGSESPLYFAVLTDFRLEGSPGSGLVVTNEGQLPSPVFGEVTPLLQAPRCSSGG